jgi:hypothetical protein
MTQVRTRTTRGARLQQLARVEFPDIGDYPAEIELLSKVALGEALNLRANPQDVPWRSTSDNVDAPPREWGRDREIRATLIRWLCVDSEARGLVDPRGLQLLGVRIVAHLDLSYTSVPFPISLIGCRLATVNVSNAALRSLNLAASWGGQFTGGSAAISESLSFFQFRADGQINLINAQVGNVTHDAASVHQYGVFASGLSVAGNASFGSFTSSRSAPIPLTVNGPLVLRNARIGGDLLLNGGQFVNPQRVAVDLSAAVVKGIASFSTAEGPPGEAQYLTVDGAIDLRRASVGLLLLDQIYSSWPQTWYLEDLVYDNVALKSTAFPEDLAGGYSPNAALGLAWLRLDPSHPTQPHRQFARVLEDRLGDIAGATQVREALEQILSERDDSPVVRALRGSIGYGYRPGNAIWGLAVVTGIGWLVYWRSYRMGLMVPTDKEACDSVISAGRLPSHYPPLSPLAYSFENTFPLIKLGQADRWQPKPEGKVPSQALRWFRWAQILVGWLLAGLFAAAVAHLVQRL